MENGAASPASLPVADTEADRAAWLAKRDEVTANASRPYSVAATALVGRVTVERAADRPATASRGPEESSALIPAEDEPWRRGRGGSGMGRAVHAALQDIDLRTGQSLSEICERHAVAEGIREPERVAEVANLVRAVIGLDLIRRVVKGPHWKEVYVTVPLPTLGGGILEGFVDLVYEGPSGDLGIVDYKTDTIASGGSLQQAARPYRLQIGAYAHAVEAATGRRVSEAWIVFARRAAEGLQGAYRVPDLEGARRDASVAAFEQISEL